MATITGGIVEVEPFHGALPPFGRTDGLVGVRVAGNRRTLGHVFNTPPDPADTHTDVVPTSGPGVSPTSFAVDLVEFDGHGGEQWFEKMHVYPGGILLNPNYDQGFKIQFGDILAQQDREYEIFNASRRGSSTLTTITKTSVSPGIETPEITPPLVLGPQTSMLAGASTYNKNLTSGLGVPVRVNIRALQDGIARFDGPVSFTFSLGVANVNISGNRVSMITSNYDFPFSETMEFLTDIIPATAGKEQRIAARKQDRERYACVFRLDGIERQRMRALLFAWHNQTFGVPMFHEGVKLTAASSIGASQFQITDGNNTDFRVGGLAIVLQDALIFDVVEVLTVTDTLLTITGTADNAYAVGTKVVPVRPCRIVGQVKTKLHKFNNLEEFQVLFESIDNDTGRAAPDTSLWEDGNTYNGRPLLDDCNIMGLSMRTVMDRNIVVLDNATGKITTTSAWPYDKRGSSKGFFAQTKGAIQDLKAFIRGVRGRQRSFYLPTFTNDLTAGDTLLSGQSFLDIEKIDYQRYVAAAGPMSVFRITFDDATSLVRVIQSAIDHPSDATLERLNLDTTWPGNRGVDEVVRIEFYERVRFNTDRFRIIYNRVGQAKLTAPVQVVFD